MLLALVGDSTTTSAAPLPAPLSSPSVAVTRGARFFRAAGEAVAAAVASGLAAFAAFPSRGPGARFAGALGFFVVAMRSSLPAVCHPRNNPGRPEENALRGEFARRTG